MSVSQSHTFIDEWKIVNTTHTPDTAFSGTFLIQVYTSTPHNLVTGQLVTITGSQGYVTLTSGQTVSFNVSNAMIEVTSSRTFIYSLRQWYFDASSVAQSYTSGYGGTVSIQIIPGVSLEYQIALVNTLNVNAWFNIPHLADDDYIQNMALLIRDTLNPSLKAYIEYSNEIWNW